MFLYLVVLTHALKLGNSFFIFFPVLLWEVWGCILLLVRLDEKFKRLLTLKHIKPKTTATIITPFLKLLVLIRDPYNHCT